MQAAASHLTMKGTFTSVMTSRRVQLWILTLRINLIARVARWLMLARGLLTHTVSRSEIIAQNRASAANDARDARTPFSIFLLRNEWNEICGSNNGQRFFLQFVRFCRFRNTRRFFSAVRVQQLHLSMNLFFLLSKQQQRTEGWIIFFLSHSSLSN